MECVRDLEKIDPLLRARTLSMFVENISTPTFKRIESDHIHLFWTSGNRTILISADHILFDWGPEPRELQYSFRNAEHLNFVRERLKIDTI